MENNLSVLVLSAGLGTRMKSSLPKVLHPVCEVPMIERVLRSVIALKPKEIAIVIGRNGDQIASKIRGKGFDWGGFQKEKIQFVRQAIPKGSGHAVQCSSAWIKKISNGSDPALLVLCADVPLISCRLLQSLVLFHYKNKNGATVCAANFENPFGYGRIIKNANGWIRNIVEEKDAAEPEKKISEINCGVYCFEPRQLLEVLPLLKNANAKREYYLTDVIELLSQRGVPATAFQIGEKMKTETLGINSRADLAAAEGINQKKILELHMQNGVSILNPQFTYIGEKVKIGRDTLLLPGTMLLGKTKIGRNCKIGPHAYIEETEIGNGVAIRASFIYGSKIGDSAQIGPFSHLRPGTRVADGARVGNFSEIKNSKIGRGTKVSHLTYIGDATLGEEINIGAGAITCNFDGKKKYRTAIGSKSFIGSNVNLIAPVKIGSRAVVGAGSTIQKDVPANALAIERALPIIKRNWRKRK